MVRFSNIAETEEEKDRRRNIIDNFSNRKGGQLGGLSYYNPRTRRLTKKDKDYERGRPLYLTDPREGRGQEGGAPGGIYYDKDGNFTSSPPNYRFSSVPSNSNYSINPDKIAQLNERIKRLEPDNISKTLSKMMQMKEKLGELPRKKGKEPFNWKYGSPIQPAFKGRGTKTTKKISFDLPKDEYDRIILNFKQSGGSFAALAPLLPFIGPAIGDFASGIVNAGKNMFGRFFGDGMQPHGMGMQPHGMGMQPHGMGQSGGKYILYNVNVSDSQKKKIVNAIKNQKGIEMIFKSSDLFGDHPFYFTKTQIKQLEDSKIKNKGVKISLSQAQIKYNSKKEGGFLHLLIPAIMGLAGAFGGKGIGMEKKNPSLYINH